MISALRMMAAVWSAKLAIWLIRVLGKGGGSTYPGKLAQRIDPQILRKRAASNKLGNIIVTGTNGKTTTSQLLSSLLRRQAGKVIHNRSGANLYHGLVTATVEGAGWLGQGADYGLFEVDEATIPMASADLHPKLMLVTNLFRDQLDRFGELEYSLSLVRNGLSHLGGEGILVLNADDPLVASLGFERNCAVVYYGLELPTEIPLDSYSANSDAHYCRRCGHPLVYRRRYMGHLGHYECHQCGLTRPEPLVKITEYHPAERAQPGRLKIEFTGEKIEANWQLIGFYNIYNALAAAAAAWSLQVPSEEIKRGLASFRAGFGRMETIEFNGLAALVTLVKNPTGFNQVLRTVRTDRRSGKVLLMAINDLYADGTDVSWLWDVEFEQLVQDETIVSIICSGIRAADMALRLKYAGWSQAKLLVEPDLLQALHYAKATAPEDASLYILPTYTAMLQIREKLQARPFWET